MPEPQDHAPALRGFQFDPGGIGAVENSVNLFRGDVTLTQDLILLAGPPDKPDLGLKLSALYQSNVVTEAMRSNRDAPTGTLGLGRMLPLERIELDDGGAAATRSYAFVGDGNRTPLVREPSNPVRFDGAIGDAAGLADGAAVPAKLRARFAEHGLALDPAATVHAGASAQSWTIVDPKTEQLFDLDVGASALVVRDGGEAYQLLDYRFWHVLYYPRFERWVIVRESGMVSAYGGGLGTQGGARTSAGSSIEWGVRWARPGDAGAALWRGPSTHTSDAASVQQQYARVWHLESVNDPWGDSIRYAYNGFARGDDGLLPGVEQRVGGAGGLPYTKACYLTRVEDPLGRALELTYAEKTWADPATHPGDAREYLDPHRSTPAGTPNAYQDRYETRYLERIVATSATGEALGAVAFGYDLIAVAGYPPPDRLFGDTVKRVLTSITQEDGSGDALPALQLQYYGGDPAPDALRSIAPAGTAPNDDPADAAPGALRSITYPGGATATYAYTKTELDICQRRIVLSPPAVIAGDAPIPRVWFGSDYCVSMWYDNARGKLALEVLTWIGRWVPWQPAASPLIFDNPSGVDLATLDVITREEFFAVRLEPDDTQADLYIFTRDMASPADWVPYTTAGGAPTACNTPSLSFDTTTASLTVAAGDTFVAALLRANDGTKATLTRATHVWSERAWREEQVTTAPSAWIVAGAEYVLTLALPAGSSVASAELTYVDQLGTWHSGGRKDVPKLAPPLTGDVNVRNVGHVPGFAVASGSGFAVAGSLQSTNWATTVSYGVDLLAWDEHYQFSAPVHWDFADHVQRNETFTALPYVARVVGDSLVALGANVLRFDGSAWQCNSVLAQQEVPNAAQRRFADGPDYVVQTVYSSFGLSAGVLVFDPEADCGGRWQRPAIEPQPPIAPSDDPAGANWPTAGGADLLTVGPHLYARGSATDWKAQLAAPLATIDGPVDTGTLVDAAPGFLGYHHGTNGDGGTTALLLRNGAVGAVVDLGKERYAKPAAGGTAPAGPDAFVTFPADAESLDVAHQLFLYRWAAQALTTPIVEYPVTRLTISDGFEGTTSTAYIYDPATAACDASGDVVKHYKVTTYPGADAPAKQRHGWIETRYRNGTGADVSMLTDGYLDGTTEYDAAGKVVSSTASTWKVFRDRNSDPLVPAPAPLRGGFVIRDGEQSMTDGVAGQASTSYVPDGLTAPYSGQPVTSTTHNRGGDGKAETWTRHNTYGYAVDPATRALHILDTTVAAVDVRTAEDGTAVATGASATTLGPWPATNQGCAVSVPGPTCTFTMVDAKASGGAFDFAAYVPGRIPAGWRRDRVVRARSPHGLVVDTVDAAGLVTSITTDTAGRLALARFTGASAVAGEVLYQGFEPDEDRSHWKLGAATIIAQDAHIGTSALRLPAGATATTAVTPAKAAGRYLLGCWYKAASGAQATATVEVVVDGTVHDKVTLALGPSDGVWTHVTTGIPLPTTPGQVTLRIALANPGSTEVLVDGVHVHPVAGGCDAQVFEPDTLRVSATVAATGLTLRQKHDAQGRLVALARGADQVTCGLRFFSRRGNVTDRFDASDPSCLVAVRGTGASTLETFRDGDGWTRGWRATGSWAGAGGTLWHDAGAAGTLARNAAVEGTWAIATELSIPPAGVTSPLGVGFADGVSVLWDPATKRWRLDGAEPLATPPSMGRSWLAVALGTRLLFFADGQLLFSHDTGKTLAAPQLEVGADRVGLRWLAWLSPPALSVQFLDGASRVRQRQRLLGDDMLVSETIYDDLGRAAVRTKWAPASAGSGGGKPLAQHRAGFVDLAAFAAAMATTGVMTGDIATYWSVHDDTGRSDDGGFPYNRRRFEDAPPGRAVELGLPGTDHAIRDLHATEPATRATPQLAFGANDAETLGAVELPANEYLRKTTTSPRKTVSRELVDRRGAAVARVTPMPDPSQTVRSLQSKSYAPAGSIAALELPNCFAGEPVRDPQNFVRRVEADVDGRERRRVSPDAGTTRTASDSAGRVRFESLDLAPGAPPAVRYYRYDVLGRIIERGTIAFAWTDASDADLRAQCDDQAWPSSASSAVHVGRTMRYDGDGSDPALLGRTVEVVTTNGAGGDAPTTVSERFTYAVTGEVLTASTTIGAGAALVVTNVYDPSGSLAAIVLPSGESPVARLAYHHDELDRVVAIDVVPADGGEQLTIEYAYSAQDQVVSARRTKGSAVLDTRSAYDAAGWPANRTLSAGSKTLARLDYTHAVDGMVKTHAETFAPGGVDAWQAKTTYTYDDLLRLVGADGQMTIDRYDPDGNIWGLTAGASKVTFDHQPGSNRLASVSIAGGDPKPIVVDPAGRVTAAPHPTDATATNHIAYDDALGLTATIRVQRPDGSRTVEAIYDGRGLRVQRTIRDGNVTSTSTTLRSGDGSKLLELSSDGARRAYVHGPDGLSIVVAAPQSGGAASWYACFGDHLGSVRAVVGLDGSLAEAYDYLPFGAVAARRGSTPVIGPCFTGKALDPVTGLYDFHARLYDPALARFLSPDPKAQLTSAYAYCSNNPLNQIDPTGELSMWARVGIGIGMALMAIIGIGISIATGGAAAPAVAEAEAALGGAEAGAAGAAAAGEAATATAAAGEGAAAGASVTTASTSLASQAGSVAGGIGGGAISGAGISGGVYDVQHGGDDFTTHGFLTALASGAVGGAISGGVGAYFAPLLSTVTEGTIASYGLTGAAAATQRIFIPVVGRVLIGSAASAASKAVGQIVTNEINHDKWDQNVGHEAWMGALTGAASGAVSGGISGSFTAFPRAGQLATSAATWVKSPTGVVVIGSLASSGAGAYVLWGEYAFGVR